MEHLGISVSLFVEQTPVKEKWELSGSSIMVIAVKVLMISFSLNTPLLVKCLKSSSQRRTKYNANNYLAIKGEMMLVISIIYICILSLNGLISLPPIVLSCPFFVISLCSHPSASCNFKIQLWTFTTMYWMKWTLTHKISCWNKFC